MGLLFAIDFACNDPDNGMFDGKAMMAQYGDVELTAPIWGGFRFTETPKGVRIHRREFVIRDRKEWLGNWCWNRYWFRRPEAKRLLLTLRANGWRCTCGPERFFDWWNKAPDTGEGDRAP